MNPTFSRSSFLITTSIFLALAVSATPCDAQTVVISSAVLDEAIPESIREIFDDDGSNPMKSVPIDLNSDKNPEKLIPNEFLCGNGGCPWVIYSPKLSKVIGRFFGNTIVILDTSTEGYKTIQTSWSLGADKTGTAVYKFRNGAYEQDKPGRVSKGP